MSDFNGVPQLGHFLTEKPHKSPEFTVPGFSSWGTIVVSLPGSSASHDYACAGLVLCEA